MTALVCPSCAAPRPEGARFCCACGTRLDTHLDLQRERKVVTVCPSCAEPCPDGARFCPACGTPQTPAGTGRAAPASRAGREERRIVTTLFCDLVDFTALAERADPEDVDGLLRPYFALTRHVIEQHGGVVEKFIGDAVVGIFGVPTLHEDDAERGIRAAVRLQERMSELPLMDGRQVQARIAVNTGHTLVQLGVDPTSGEGFIVGDSVNTAARLQAVAPPGGVVVGEMTRSLAAHAATYEAMGPVHVKGKRRVLRPWLATGGVTRPGVDLHRSFATSLVGREVELGILAGMFDNARASATPQIAFIVAEAGLGKSRLVHELARGLDERSDVFVWWRQTRCPPYGEGLSLWPLAQIVREHTGIYDGDDEAACEHKLLRALEGEPDAPWLARRLRPLLGLPSTAAPKDENFAAWLRFIELMARTKPTMLVFEDVHWASPIMVEFLWYLAAHVDNVPLLGIGTARPEFLQAHPEYEAVRAADQRLGRVVQLDLRPLSPPEACRLVSSLLGDGPSTEALPAIVQRCGGNPLYMEELAALLRDDAGDAGDAGELARVGLSLSLQTLIAARLDSLPPDLKGLLSDAAVLGEEFSADALAVLSGRPLVELKTQLDDLARRQLVRASRRVPSPDDGDYGFWHSLTRDVAYERMTRSDRALKHQAVAEFMERPEHPQTADFAEVLAHHYTTAFRLLRATGSTASADRLREPAAKALLSAGDRSRAVDWAQAKGRTARRSTCCRGEPAPRSAARQAWAGATGDRRASRGRLQP